jgi:hypothetical protein
MTYQIVRLVKDLAEAERAHEELLAAGFEREDVKLDVYEDEAGPAKGNFTVGDPPEVAGGSDYSRTFAHKPGDQQPHCLVTVNAADVGQAEQAHLILARHGGIDPDAAARHSHQPTA